MALLLRDRDAAPEVEAPRPVGDGSLVVPDFACETCGAGMQAGQDWCLECGTAAPGRLGARPGWRSAFTVVALSLLLVSGAVAAAYAALTDDAQRSASQPSAGNGNPIVAQAPPAAQPPAAALQPGATGPGTTAPAPQAQPVVPTPVPKLTAPSQPVAPAPAPSGNSGATGGSTAGQGAAKSGAGAKTAPKTTPAAPVAPAAPQEIAIKADGASTYDPYKRPGAEFGPAANVVDKHLKTVWDVTVPADGSSLRVGLVLDLGAQYALDSLTIATPTPGFDVELYGATGKALPQDVLDSRWEHLTDRRHFTGAKPIVVKGKSKAKHRLVLLWFTQPANVTDPRIAIGDVKIRGIA